MASFPNAPGRLVLVVDDDPTVLRSITAALAPAGLRVIVAENGAAGLEAFFGLAEEPDLVITDVAMPVMDGIAMSEEIRKHRPYARIVLMSAYSDAAADRIDRARFRLVHKPFLPDDLIRVLHMYLQSPNESA